MLAGKICLVTGASRGIGKGIALQLGEAGAKVYITGRTLKPVSQQPGISLEEVALEIKNRGGQCIPLVCDHSNENEIEQLFEKIKFENDGVLDILVNNAYAAVTRLLAVQKGESKFWQTKNPAEHWDTVNNVGLRNHYICSAFAAQMMVPREKGLIVNISSAGGLSYLFDVAYGVGKAALDRMAADCAVELKRHNVACVSLWPGAVNTELVQMNYDKMSSKAKELFKDMESTEFSGRAIVHLAADKNIMKKTGRILFVADLANEYGFTDINGEIPISMRSLKMALNLKKYKWLANWIPSWLKIPVFFMHQAANKF